MALDRRPSTYKKIKDNNEQKKFKICKVCASLLATEETNPLEAYMINARPTFLLFKDGDQVAKVDGVSMPTLEKLINEHMPEGLLEDEPEADAAAEDED